MPTSPFPMVKGDYCTGLTPAGIIRRLEVHGPQLFLGWDYPRTYAPTGFVVTLTREGDATQTVTVTPTSGHACRMFSDTGADSFCTQMACPATGLYHFTVRAIVGQRQSEPSAVLTLACLSDTTHCTCDTMTRPLIRDVASQSNPDPTAATLGTAEPEPFAATAPGASAPQPIPTPAILGPLSQEGTNLVLRWSYPRTTEATPTRFILSYTGENFYSLVLYAVPLHEV